MINESLKVIGEVKIYKNDVLEQEVNNLVVGTGRTFIANRFSGTNTINLMSHMAIGSGNVAPVDANTTLGGELGRVTLTSTTSTANSVTYVATFPPGTATGNVYEAGIFNAVSAGTMLSRVTFGIITKGSLDTITVTWTISVV